MKANLKRLDGQSTEFGYFASQGKHTGADGIADYTYAGLAQALELGYFPKEGRHRKPMPFMEHVAQRTIYGINRRNSKVNRAYRAWGRNITSRAGMGSPARLLNAVGEFAQEQSEVIFGNPAYFPQAPKNKTPLVTTGELKKNFAYKTSWDNKVRTR